MKRKPNIDGAMKTARMLLGLAPMAAKPGRGAEAYLNTTALDLTNDVRFDPTKAEPIINAAAAGDQLARKAVHTAAKWFVENGEPLPDVLRRYVVDLLLVTRGGPGRRGRKPHQNFLRDYLIRHAVRAVCEYGFAETRNPATSTPSACSIVAEVLAENGVHMTERNVEEIVSPSQHKPKKAGRRSK